MGVYVPWLVDAARLAARGTDWTVVVWPGWDTRGQGPMRLVEGVVGHHTATPESAPGDYPSATVVRLGRAGLSGLLAQLGLGRRKEIHVFGGGLAYHAGASAYAGYVDLNDEFIGIEAEDSGDGHWTPEALFMYPRLVGACLLYMRRGVDRYASHRTVARPAGRKPDPAGISDVWMRDRAARFMAGDIEEDDMQLTDRVDWDAINDLGPDRLGHKILGTWQHATALRAILARTEAKVDAIGSAVGQLTDDEANIIAALRARGEGLTADEQAAVIKAQLDGSVLRALRTLLTAGQTEEVQD